MKKILLCLSLFVPIVSSAVELPKTEAEFWQRFVYHHPLIVMFVPDRHVVVAIVRAESRFNPRAVNYNCWYSIEGDLKERKTEKTDRSTSCKYGDEYLAWSVDCGLAQINRPGRKCPDYLFEPNVNMAQFVNLYLQRGFQPWDASKSKWRVALGEG